MDINIDTPRGWFTSHKSNVIRWKCEQTLGLGLEQIRYSNYIISLQQEKRRHVTGKSHDMMS